MQHALEALGGLQERVAQRVGVGGNREYNPGWHTALDLGNLLTVSEAITRSAIERKESRGGHFREDYPRQVAEFGTHQHRDARKARRRHRWRSAACPFPRCRRSSKQVDRGADRQYDEPRRRCRRDTSWRMRLFKIWRASSERKRAFRDYSVDVVPGMVVLDAVHQIQATQAPDLAVRWNCKAGQVRVVLGRDQRQPAADVHDAAEHAADGRAGDGRADAAFPLIKDLVTDVSWNYRVKKTIKPFKPRPPDAPDGTWRMFQKDVDRVQEFRKCIECFLCQDVCHILRDHQLHDEFIGPRFLTYAAALEMHPLDVEDRVPALKDAARHRLLQHHAVLHEGLSRAHHDHRKRDHSAQGARRRSVLRSDHAAASRVSILR